MFRLYAKILLALITFFCTTNAQYAARVYSKHESIQDFNVSRPRIFVENTGSETIKDFYYYYYFTVENNKIPTVENYHTPNCDISLEDLNYGNYRVKYNFKNVNFAPGDILPDAQGNIVGLRYIDWSAWDKTNDYSFDNNATFQQNGKIPVYLTNGTQISGSSLPNPQTPPQPPELKYSNSQYAVFSTEYTDIRDNATIKGGIVGSLTYTEIGSDAVTNGDVLSGGDIFLRERAKIGGNVSATQAIKKQNNTEINGIERNYAEIMFPEITLQEVIPGTYDAAIGPNQTGAITPNSYREIIVFANATVTFSAGVYNVDRFIVEPDAKIIFESQKGKTTEIRVKSECRIGDRAKFQFTGETVPLSISIYSEQTTQLRVGTDATVYGRITAPNANIVVNSRTTVYGMLMGKQVIIEPQGLVCKPATLLDFRHSEWAYAKGFDPISFEYKAIVPDTTKTLQIIPYIPQDAQVVVNGNSYGNGVEAPISLTNTSTDITVEVKSPENCGKTVYVIKIIRSSNYQIYVNEKSPALAGKEDGKSWQSAYKSLQQAIDAASIEGKEIWVAEGSYYPEYLTDKDDPRTATFLIKPGIEIIGGFKGNETEKKPTGSPYKTILSGDIGKNDTKITFWPPNKLEMQYMNDNAYHTVTIDGNIGSKGIKIEGVTISGGVANGEGINGIGAGVYNKNGSPTFVFTVVERNYSSSGAGIMDKGGIREITNCLLSENVAQAGGGGGIYIAKGEPRINASVFAKNSALGSFANTGGGAIFVNNSKLAMVNSVFTFNVAETKGGAIYNLGSELTVINSTFSENRAISEAQGIWNGNASLATLKNTILWNNAKKSELGGDGFEVSYSCLPDVSVIGQHNLNKNPEFINDVLPTGDDGYFGSSDDGLRLKQNSPCINAGDNADFPTMDLLSNMRPIEDKVDIGAYEMPRIEEGFEEFEWGCVNVNNEMRKIGKIVMREGSNYDLLISSLAARSLRVTVEKNKYITSKDSIYAYIKFKDASGNNYVGANFSSGYKVWFYRTGETSSHYQYTTLRGKNGKFVNGKPMIMVENKESGDVSNPNYYLIPSPLYASFLVTVPTGQF